MNGIEQTDLTRMEGPKETLTNDGPLDEVIYLERGDDVDIILDRLDWISGRHVILVVPGASDMLADLVTLRLIQRRARALGLDLFLVAGHGLTRRLAAEIGLRAYPNTLFARWAMRRLQRKHGTPRRVIKRKGAGVPEIKERRRRKLRTPTDRFRIHTARPATRFFSHVTMVLIGVALAGALAYTALILVPGATVTVVPATREVEATAVVIADLQARRVDYAARTVPARIVEVRLEGAGQIPTRSTQAAPDAFAAGEVIFTNRTPQEVTVPAGTVVRTATGENVRFTTVNEVKVPAGIGMRAPARIVAIEPGPAGNVRPFQIAIIEGVLGLQLSVINEQGTVGGTVRQVGVVTQADKDELKRMLLAQLREEAERRILEQIDEGEFVPPETIQVFVISELYDRFAGEAAESLGLKLMVSANGLVIAEPAAHSVALDALQSSVPSDYYVAAYGLSFSRGAVMQIDESRRVYFPVTARGIAVARIETRGLREALRGQTLPMAEAILMERLPLKKRPTIEVTPPWFDAMPVMPFRITILVVTELD